MADARDDWWIIGSAAVALHGRDPGGIADIDVLLSEADATALLEPRGILPQQPSGTDLFRSRFFAHWDGTPLPTEFMAGFELCEGGKWTPIWPRTREAVDVDGAALFVPSREELKDILVRFGRGKDLARATLL